MKSSTIATTTTTAVGGDKDLCPIVRKIKNSKKQDLKNKEDTCMMQEFLGTPQYTNCKGTETEVKIVCDNTNDAATATTKKIICLYSKYPVQYDGAAAATAVAVGCGDHGLFDPKTHLTWDHATGMSRLEFILLTHTCFGVPASRGFWLMVEAPPSTGPGSGPGTHNHAHHEDKNHKDNSGMLLRFSTDDGVNYYNSEHPRKKVVLLYKSSPSRKL